MEAQLRILAECGVTLAPGVEPGVLTRAFTPAQFEADPFRLVLTRMGGEAEDAQPAGPSGFLSDDIWHFDTECIEDVGDYSRIAARLAALAKGELPLEGIGRHEDSWPVGPAPRRPGGQ